MVTSAVSRQSLLGAPWKPSVWTPGGWAQSPWRGELSAGFPPLAQACRLRVQEFRTGGKGDCPATLQLQERESSQGWTAQGKGGPGVGTLSWVSQGTLCHPGVPRACARAHLRAWALSGQDSFGSTNCHYSVRPTWGPRSSRSCLVAVGKAQMASRLLRWRMCSGVTGPGTRLCPLPCCLPPSPRWAVITAPRALLPATPTPF